MKVLLKSYDGKCYVWKDATYSKSGFVVNGDVIRETDIISVMDDNRSKFVTCSECGEIFAKDSPEIEKHKMRYKDTNTCLTCAYLRPCESSAPTTSYEHISGARYHVVNKYDARMTCCRSSWSRRCDIGTEEAMNACIHKKCSNATMIEVNDIFTKNPGIFDDIITIDRVVEVGYKSMRNEYNGIYTAYALNGRNQIEARVNSAGIVEDFIIRYGRNSYMVMYSKQLNKLYKCNGSIYIEWNPSEIKDSVKAYITKKIAALYN